MAIMHLPYPTVRFIDTQALGLLRSGVAKLVRLVWIPKDGIVRGTHAEILCTASDPCGKAIDTLARFRKCHCNLPMFSVYFAVCQLLSIRRRTLTLLL